MGCLFVGVTIFSVTKGGHMKKITILNTGKDIKAVASTMACCKTVPSATK